MKKSILYIILVLLFASCDIQRNVSKSAKKTDTSELFEGYKKRAGDTVSYIVPVVRYKDTTIYTVNRQGTTLRTVYDNNGNVSNIDCFSSAIDEFIRYQKAIQEEEKDKDKEESYEPDFSFLFYIIGGVVVLGIAALILAYHLISKKINRITDVVGN